MKKEANKIVSSKRTISRDQLMLDVRSHMTGGIKPSWVGQSVYVGNKAEQDWINAEKGDTDARNGFYISPCRFRHGNS